MDRDDELRQLHRSLGCLNPRQQYCTTSGEMLALVGELLELRRQVLEFRRALRAVMREKPAD